MSIRLTGEGLSLANQIKELDRKIDQTKAKEQESIARGLHNSGMAMGANLVQNEAQQQREALLTERQQLATKLKHWVDAQEQH